MRKNLLGSAVAASALIVLGGTAIALDHHGHSSWSYDGDGAPEHWGMLSADYATCDSGHEQSPIDLHAVSDAADLAPALHWEDAEGSVTDNGHTIKVGLEDAGSLHLGDRSYELVQFHFHAASEHTVDGHQYPLEVHFVHASEDGHLAVVGVFFEEGEAHPALDALWAAIPHEGDHHEVDDVNPAAFLPDDHSAWRYAGSLTTPPCSEGVAWTVMQTPVTASAEQLSAFTALYAHNYRPVQPLHERRLTAGELH
ncbi:carbonic anhydrase [Oceanicaulis sp. MMSF_3324]|uniref:carbonic anhydrase n=1 Tax=Oceanicaulis sp. MMSF_3324 TaxID=3046702 RepID=UPI00273D0D39|nr:carbonic anhydrase family protein [Oceanicaulis sp. MMSF_3324]